MDDVVALLRTSALVKILGFAFLALLGFDLVATGRGWFVFWVLFAGAITAAVLWGERTTSAAVRLTCATLASYAIGVVWLLYQWPAPLLIWVGITSLLVTAGVASYRSGPVRAFVICFLLTMTLPQALLAAVLEQTWPKDWTMF